MFKGRLAVRDWTFRYYTTHKRVIGIGLTYHFGHFSLQIWRSVLTTMPYENEEEEQALLPCEW